MIKLPSIVKAFGIVTIISGVGKLLGFGREAMIASFFGASGEADVFFVANLIPTILFTSIGTAIQAGIVPLYVKEKEKNPLTANHKMSVLGTFFVTLAIILTIVSYLFAKPLVHMMAPGFTPDQLDLATTLTMIMLPSIIFLALTSVATGVLNSNKQFTVPALAPVIQNVMIIAAILLLAGTFGITGLALGVLVGTVAQFFIQLPFLKKYALRLNFHFKKEKGELKRTLILFAPIIVAAFVVQLNGVVDRMVSSMLEVGSVSALNYAHRLLWLPLSIMLTPLITILYPNLVERLSQGTGQFMELVVKGMKILLLIAIPFEIVMLLQGEALVSLAFARGAFDEKAIELTTLSFIFFSLALPFFALRD